MKITIPGQDEPLSMGGTPVNPTWYEKFSQLFKSLNLFLERGAYSEGTWTPVLTASGGTIPTFTGTPLVGRYYKTGRLCTVRIFAANVAGGTPGAGAFQLSVSLPLPIFASAVSGRLFAGAFTNSTTEGVAFADGVAGGTVAKLYKLGSSSNQITLDCADFNNVTRGLSISFTYPVD